MPSLFSRSRTSTPKKQQHQHSFSPEPPFDEFGRVTTGQSLTSLASKKDKKKAKEHEKLRQRTARDRADSHLPPDPPPLPDGTFLPLNLDPPRTQSGTDGDGPHTKLLDYGFLSYERHVVLAIEQAARLVIVIADELASRGGITTPFIFSTTALDISSAPIRRLIRAFLNTCTSTAGHAAAEAESKWRDEARFAGPHELGMCLRWGLARVVRSQGGHDVRGLVPWEHYLHFKESEAVLGYPPTHFQAFLTDLQPTVQSILIAILTLLSRLTANSTSSGHTPPTLSPLFGPLLFGLGPPTLPFHHTYIHYLRAVNATEHILLAFIRWQDVPQPPSNGTGSFSSSISALGVPIRLKEWIKGYPGMLPFLSEYSNNTQKPQPRRGARTVRVMSVRRNVRMYSPDLVRTAASWGVRSPLHHHRSPSPSSPASPQSENGLLVSREWARIAPTALKLLPRYSEGFKKRMNMPPAFHPDLGPGHTPSQTPLSISQVPSTGSAISIGTPIEEREGDDRFRSLTDWKWGEFENLGFSGLGETSLQFDLTESARTARSTKRETLSWNDFSAAGFSRTDAPLSQTLQFSSPVAKAISTWPSHNAEITKKMKKAEKALPPFGWDTEPVVGSEEVIEEAFIDVFCDLIYGGGWMDLERGEELDRDCNWALIEFKSLPTHQTSTTGTSDPRTNTTLVLFEEFVPLEYRQQLSVTASTRGRLPSLFSPSKTKGWKQAPTLNGRPYVVGHVPRSPSYREFEFEGMLNGMGANATKVIKLDPIPHPHGHHARPGVVERVASNEGRQVKHQTSMPNSPLNATPSPMISGPLYAPDPVNHINQPHELLDVPTLPMHGSAGSGGLGSKSDEGHTDNTTQSKSTISTKRSSRFRLPVPLASPGGRRTGMMPSEYDTVDFETRLASYSDDEWNSRAGGNVEESEAAKQKRRESKGDDAWVDILVGAAARRMAGQDASVGATVSEGGGGGGGGGAASRRRVRSRRSDPDIASLEVAQVLAGVRERTPSSPSPSVHRQQYQHQPMHMHERVDGDGTGGLERFYNDQDVDEIETVPRTSDVVRSDDEDEELEPAPEPELEPEPVEDVSHHADDEDDNDEGEPEEEEDQPRSSIAAQIAAAKARRRGYFDLHPERKAAVAAAVEMYEEDPGEMLLAKDEESLREEEQVEVVQQQSAPVTPVRKLPVIPQPQPQPEPQQQQPPLQTQSHSTIASLKVQLNTPEKVNGKTSPTPSPTATPQSKTAALIEMYREKERQTPPGPAAVAPAPVPVAVPIPPLVPVAPLQPSRLPLPVRSESLHKSTTTAATPIVEVTPPPASTTPEPEPESFEAPKIAFSETGRASPARYVHGAPLHNVLEEEEEEE